MSFLVLRSICYSSSLVHFKKVPNVLRGRQPMYLSLWWDFCLIVWFREVFSFSWGVLLEKIFSAFCFSSLSWYIFLCRIPSLYRLCISSLPVIGFLILFHFLQTVWCRSCTLGIWYFSWDEVCIHLCIS